MTPEVISATEAHLPHILARWRELMAVHHALDPVLYALRPDAPSQYREHVLKQIQSPRGLVLVAPDPAGGVRGYLLGGLGKRAPMFAVREVGMIWDLAVRPTDRLGGVGRALVASALRRYRARGLRYAQVTFAPGNPLATAFWDRMGFETLLREAYLPLD